jgi:hypothetical protein
MSELKTKERLVAEQRDDLNKLKDAQRVEAAGGEKLDRIPASEDKEYKIRATEKDYFHVKTIIKHLDATSKNFIKETRIIKIHMREFKKRVEEGAFNVYDEVDILHNPLKGKDGDIKYNFKPQFADVAQAPETKSPNVGAREKALSAKESELKSKELELQERIKALEEKEKQLASKTEADQSKSETDPLSEFGTLPNTQEDKPKKK